MGGMQFLSMESVMPAMVHDLGGPGWAVALGPGLFIVGFTWPQILSVIWVERMRTMKPMIMILGFLQRLPYLFAGLFLLLYGESHPVAAMYIALVTPFVMSTLGGLQGAAYFELISRMVPINRTASMWAIRNLLMAVFGILAGIVIKGIIDTNPGTTGYGMLHMIAFVMMIISVTLLSQVKETNIPEFRKQDPVCFRSGFKVFHIQWLASASLRGFIITRMLFLMVFVLIPFLSIRAIGQTGQSTGLVGWLVTAQMIGFIFGNIVSGYLGDRFGMKWPMLVGRVLMIAGILITPVSSQGWQFMAIFFTLGFGLGTAQVGDLTMVFDFAPEHRRKFFFAVMGVLTVPGVLSAALISAVLQYVAGGFYLACLISGIGVAVSLFYLLRLRDPRMRTADAPGQ